jgi:hypothetical protein
MIVTNTMEIESLLYTRTHFAFNTACAHSNFNHSPSKMHFSTFTVSIHIHLVNVWRTFVRLGRNMIKMACTHSTFNTARTRSIFYPSQTKILEGGTKDEIRMFEALFKGVSTRFGKIATEKSVENPDFIFCSSFQNLRLGSIYLTRLARTHAFFNTTCTHSTFNTTHWSRGHDWYAHNGTHAL